VSGRGAPWIALRGLRTARRRRRGPLPLVLAYHRVDRVETDPQLLAVSPDRFAEHLQLIRERHEPLPLAALVAAVQSGDAPPGAISVTFDDGYADNLAEAGPLLERYDVPATVFVVSGAVDRQRPFWWDELERLLLRAGRLPSELALRVGRETLRWQLGDAADYTPDSAALHAGWTALASYDPTPRHQAYRELCTAARVLTIDAREYLIQQLHALLEPSEPTEAHARPLTSDELVQLASTPLVEIGSHTVTHPVLASERPNRQHDEIEGSKRWLEETLGQPVSGFAYPYGASGDFNDTTASIVRAANFGYACANVPGTLDGRTDPFRIPRIVVRDWGGDELARQLAAFER
jgi:peptidoglycan/xylan/chitin deacetylase (PgdA/CDA1 family)